VFVVFQELGICQVSADSYQKILVTNGGLILYKVGFKKSIYATNATGPPHWFKVMQELMNSVASISSFTKKLKK
jgi:hypothetical protein